MNTSFRFILSSCISLLLLTSCEKNTETLNENEELYGTEWASEDEKEAMSFFKDNSVLYFAQGGYSGKGSFKFSSLTQKIEFEGLTTNFGYFIGVMTYARLISEDTMKLFWHEMGKDENYYCFLYRKR